MSEPRTTLPHDPRLEALIETMDRPLLGLALVSIVLYLLDIRGVTHGWPEIALTTSTFVIDLLFAMDLTVKLVVLGRDYTNSPWFLIDLLSSLPLFDTLANGVLPLRAVRFLRGFRILRIFRGLRVMRALRAMPGFERFSRAGKTAAHTRNASRAMSVGMLLLTVAMLLTIVIVRRAIEEEYIERINAAVTEDLTLRRLAAMGGSLERPADASTVLVRSARVDHQHRDVYFDLHPIDRRVDQFEFFLTVGMMFSMIMFLYIMGYHHLDVTETQLRGLLNLALPVQVADQFVSDPNAYTRKCRMPATVLFMDFVGFTHTCEVLANDPDKLSMHLEAAMDRLVNELARHDMIIDKFIGDAVMSFRGGPLVSGTPTDHARHAVWAAIDSSFALDELKDEYFHCVKIGGASADDCLIGAFGTSARLSYTILGDGVNLAARLEPACGQCGTQNLFDEVTYQLCFGIDDFSWRRWGWIRVAGKSGPIQVYEAFDSSRLLDREFIATFHLALDAFENHDFDRARDLFLLADSQRRVGDHPSRLYAHRCEALILGGRPVGWEPIFETHK